VVDDGVPTARPIWSMQHQASWRRVRCASAKSARQCLRAGFAWGSNGATRPSRIDADFHDPTQLPSLLPPPKPALTWSSVRANVPGGSIPNWSWSRHLLSWGGNRYASAVLAPRGRLDRRLSGLPRVAAGAAWSSTACAPRLRVPDRDDLSSPPGGATICEVRSGSSTGRGESKMSP